jgi:hypothetical protein
LLEGDLNWARAPARSQNYPMLTLTEDKGLEADYPPCSIAFVNVLKEAVQQSGIKEQSDDLPYADSCAYLRAYCQRHHGSDA